MDLSRHDTKNQHHGLEQFAQFVTLNRLIRKSLYTNAPLKKLTTRGKFRSIFNYKKFRIIRFKVTNFLFSGSR
jgi:hypothetical protein